jgi:hypothetical protein
MADLTQPQPAGGAPASPQAPPPAIPTAPASNPFDRLPFPSPGDRIKSDDIKAVSQALTIVANMTRLSGSLLGHTFAEARGLLVGQGYQLMRVMTVFGSEIDNVADTTLDARKVVQVVSTNLGDRGVAVVVTEAVDARRFVPNLSGLTYPQAHERVQALVGQVSPGGAPPTAQTLVGLTLADAVKGANQMRETAR